MFHHVVTFSFTDEAHIEEAARRLRAMEGRVPSLRHIEVGIDTGRTPRSVHLALITRFEDEAGYRAYAVDPVHKDVLAYMATVVASASVVDWET